MRISPTFYGCFDSERCGWYSLVIDKWELTKAGYVTDSLNEWDPHFYTSKHTPTHSYILTQKQGINKDLV